MQAVGQSDGVHRGHGRGELRRGGHGRDVAILLVAVDNRAEVRDFLTTRSARIAPRGGRPADLRRAAQGARPAADGGRSVRQHERRVVHEPGAREPGWRLRAVLDSLARALNLDNAERELLFDLARAASTSARTSRRVAGRSVRPSVYWIGGPGGQGDVGGSRWSVGQSAPSSAPPPPPLRPCPQRGHRHPSRPWAAGLAAALLIGALAGAAASHPCRPPATDALWNV